MSSKPVISPWRRLIDTSKVMSIAVGSNGTAWSAPVYYLFDAKMFYFFSNPESRHIKLSNAGLASASIFRDDPDIKNLAGIQMSGTILKAPLNAESVMVAKRYCTLFNISGNAKDILSFFASKFHASLYCFEPQIIYYMDNSKGFGSREEVVL
jgi:uncharacterized protein YhbP (UPF0306 family)